MTQNSYESDSGSHGSSSKDAIDLQRLESRHWREEFDLVHEHQLLVFEYNIFIYVFSVEINNDCNCSTNGKNMYTNN
jgi:hypothetical protein